MTHRSFVEAPMRVNDLWIIAVGAMTEERFSGRLGRSVFLAKTPRVIVIVGPDGVRALGVDGSSQDAAQLVDRIPELRAAVSAVRETDESRSLKTRRSAGCRPS